LRQKQLRSACFLLRPRSSTSSADARRGQARAADLSDLAAAFTFALRYQGRKRVHNADELMAEIVTKWLVEHLKRAGFVVMKRPPKAGAAAAGRGYEG
jgi:hypothetical protein